MSIAATYQAQRIRLVIQGCPPILFVRTLWLLVLLHALPKVEPLKYKA